MQEIHRIRGDQTSMSGPGGARRRTPVRSGLVILVVLAASVLFVVGIRKSIAEHLIQQHCAKQELVCDARVRALGLGNVVIEQARASLDASELATLERLEVRFGWTGVMSPKVTSATIDGLALTLNATGKGHVLGPLQVLAPTSDASGGEGRTFPAIKLDNAHIRLLTTAGVVDMSVKADVQDAQNLAIGFSADPTFLEMDGSRISLRAANGQLRLAGAAMDADVKLNIDSFGSDEMDLEGLDLTVSLSQAGGPLRLHVNGVADQLRASDAVVSDVSMTAFASANAQLSATTPIDDIIAKLRELDVEVSSASGRVAGIEGRGLRMTALLEPAADGEVLAGAVLATAASLDAPGSSSGRAQLATDLVRLDPSTLEYEAISELRLNDAGVEAGALRKLFQRASLPAFLTTLDQVLEDALVAASAKFDVEAPLRLTGRGLGKLQWRAIRPIRVIASNGDQIRFVPHQKFFADNAEQTDLPLYIQGQLDARLGPVEFQADLATLRGSREKGDMRLGATVFSVDHHGRAPLVLKVSSPQLSVDWSKGDLTIDAGRALQVEYSGTWQGLAFDEVVIEAAVLAQRDGQRWTLSAPRGAALSINGIGSRWVSFGAMQTRLNLVQPISFSGEGSGAIALAGKGITDAIAWPFTVGERRYDLKVGSASFNLTGHRNARSAIDWGLTDAQLVFDAGFGPIQLDAPTAPARLVIGDRWLLKGDLQDASGKHGLARIEGLNASFQFNSGKTGLEGLFDNIAFRIRDSQSPARWAAMDYDGEANLRSGVITALGDFSHPLFEDVRAQTHLTHDLSNGEGAMTMAPAEMRFRTGGLQPAAVFPVLRGVVANVTGAVTASGRADWGDEFATQGVLDLTDVGFASGKAGVFRGVFGRLVLSDIIHVQSPPGQELVIHEWNPGVPLNSGVVRFQLDGLERVRLEHAAFPWVGGKLVAQPMEWRVNGDLNTVVVDAENLDLAALVDRFGIPDTEASGSLSGVFPVEFATGAVYVRDAELHASEGRLAYTGALPVDPAQPDDSVQLMFNALSDFRFQVLKVGLDGDIAGEMTLSMDVLGHNPAVLDGYPFDLNITATAELLPLLSINKTGERELERISRLLSRQRPLMAGE